MADDRILASTLELSRNHPTAPVRLLSNDAIMLAKADEAGITAEELRLD